jgi:hypothetical protein
VSSSYSPAPSRILGMLLSGHSEAPSLLAEASHRQALTEHSSVTTSQAFEAAQAARVRYEELRHRLDPRYGRGVHFGAGALLLAGTAVILALLNGLELGTVLTAKVAMIVTIAAVAVWLTGAWLAALASREGRRSLVAASIAGAITLSFALAALHGLSSHWRWLGDGLGVGVLAAILITVLAASAMMLITRMEPGSIFLARRRWQRTQATYEAAFKLKLTDAETAAVAKQSWLGLVRTYAFAAAGEDGEQVVQDTLALAAILQEVRRISAQEH